MEPTSKRGKTARKLTSKPRRSHNKKNLVKSKISSCNNPKTSSSVLMEDLPSSNSGASTISSDNFSKIDINEADDIDQAGSRFDGDEDHMISTTTTSSPCSTPKAQRFRIPKMEACPPAPKKQRPVLSNCSLHRTPIAFFAPPDLELFFFFALSDISV